ncbi:MAG: putative colanic acid biosynthesis acetyltransferase [Bdellovibrionales bacterium]
MTDSATEPQATMDLSLFKVPQGFRGRPSWVVQLWWIVQSLLIHTTPQFMYGWRRFLWRLFGAKIGDHVMIRPSARVTYPWKVSVGDNSWIGDRAELYSLGPIDIGSNAVVSQDSYLCAATHDHEKPDFPLVAKAIHIEDQVWIAAGCFIAPGVTIGRGAILGARSVALRDIPPAAIYAGHPAKLLKMRTEQG